ncbi:MAG: hypothetical protein FWF82_03490 [Oscillospiraceae bacterium]|nr:hypothetical protein [Oscillospiraceae bacterium]
MDKAQVQDSRTIPEKKTKKTSSGGGFLNKLVGFFSNKWTKFGFSFISAGYLWFLGQVAWLTFGFYFVYENAAAVFLMYTFINVMFAVVMIYTRKCVITRIAALFMHPFILIMLVYGFGNWYLILPPFIAATVIFFAGGANESLKIILGTIHMILFVIVFLAYVTLESIAFPIPYKMDLNLRQYPEVGNSKVLPEEPPFRIVAYVDPEVKVNPRASFYVEKTDSDVSLWNLTCERVSVEKSEKRTKLGTVNYSREFELSWVTQNEIILDGQRIKIDSDGSVSIVSVEVKKNDKKDDNKDDDDNDDSVNDDNYQTTQTVPSTE